MLRVGWWYDERGSCCRALQADEPSRGTQSRRHRRPARSEPGHRQGRRCDVAGVNALARVLPQALRLRETGTARTSPGRGSHGCEPSASCADRDAEASLTLMATNNDQGFDLAYRRLMGDPNDLTERDIKSLRARNPTLGEQAINAKVRAIVA